MSLVRNKVKALIKKTFIKKLIDKGFTNRKDWLGAYRIRGEFVDVVSIQIGRNPGSLYLHYFTNLIADPFSTNLLHVRTIGERLQGNESGGDSWITDEEDGIVPMLENIWKSVETIAMPFFDNISNVAQYSKLLDEAILKSSVIYPFDLVLMRAIEGKNEESLVLIANIKEKLMIDENYDFESDEQDIALLKNLKVLESSILNDSVEQLVNQWRSDNLKILTSK